MMKIFGMFVCCVLVGPMAQAQDSGLDPRVGEAKTACAAGDLQKGIRLLAELYTATNDPIWVFNQGRCYHQNYQLAAALARFKEFIRKSKGSPDEDIRDAESYVQEIEAELQKDRPASTQTPTANPGVTTGSAQASTLEPNPGRNLRYAGLGAGILGVAALATGAVFSLLVKQTQREVEDQTKNAGVDSSSIGGELADGRRYETLQWIFYGVGAAATATGCLLYWIGTTSGRPRTSSTSVSPLFLANGAGASLQTPF